MFQDFIINLHVAPFIILFLIGFVLVTLAPIRYSLRTRTFLTFFNFFGDLKDYTNLERKMLHYGFVFAILGIFGCTIISEKFGCNMVVYDSEGNRTIVNDKEAK